MENKGKHSGNDLSEENVISILVDGVIENELTLQKEMKDPFDLYTHQLRAKIFSHPRVFKERCLQGYRNLVKEMKDKS